MKKFRIQTLLFEQRHSHRQHTKYDCYLTIGTAGEFIACTIDDNKAYGGFTGINTSYFIEIKIVS